MKDNLTYTVKRFSNSAHVILPKQLIGTIVRVIPVDSDDNFGLGELERLLVLIEGYKSDIYFMERHSYFNQRQHIIDKKRKKLANLVKREAEFKEKGIS